MKILQIIATGLGTLPTLATGDPLRDSQADCGMLDIALHVRNVLFPADEHSIVAFGWDQDQPDAECRDLLTKIQAFAPDRIIMHAHSFGNSFGVFFTQWLDRWHRGEVVIDEYLGYDPCRNPRFGIQTWAPVPGVVKRYLAHYQQGGRPFCVSGSPFTSSNGQNVDVTAWVNPTLAHIDIFWWVGIINDLRVRAAAYAFLLQSQA